MKFKTSLLCSLVAFSASTLAADDTKTYVVELSADIPSELSVQLVDGSGNEVAASQTQPLLAAMEDMNGVSRPVLYTKGLLDGYKLQSNDQGVTFKITRTLSPITLPDLTGTNLAIDKNTIMIDPNSGCTEDHVGLGSSLPYNQEISYVTTAQGNAIICPTDVEFRFNTGTQVPVGAYAATLTIDVEPNL